MKMEQFGNNQSPEIKPSGEKMEKPKWTDHDIEMANKFRHALHQFSGNFNEKKDAAAQFIGYNGYMDMPAGVRSYISHVASEMRSVKAAKKSVARAQEMSIERKEVLARMESEWYELLENNEDFRHAAIHPEDENNFSFPTGEKMKDEDN